MVGTLAQLVALVSYGNAFLSDGYELGSFYPSNSTFQFCNEVHFVEVGKFPMRGEREIAKNPIYWFEYLKENRCERLVITFTPTVKPEFPDRLTAGLAGGGGRWDIVAIFTRFADHWFGDWEVTDQHAVDRRIWKVTFVREGGKEPPSNRHASQLTTCRLKLEKALTEIEAFARRKELGGFGNCFSSGLSALTSDEPIALIYHKDLLPEIGYSREAKQLIAASSIAWVFGGMGSWNDLGFDEDDKQQEYERLSEQLYSAINSAVENSVNSFGRN